MSEFDFDIVIVGGGLAGASLACALASLPLTIAVLEAYPPKDKSQPSFDDRSVAVSAQTVELLSQWGIWQQIEEFEAIKHIHVSDQGKFSKVRMHANDYGLNMLGAVVANRVLGAALWSKLSKQDNVTVFCPVRVDQVDVSNNCVKVSFQYQDRLHELNAALVVGAEGQNSVVAKANELTAVVTDYSQVAAIANVEVARSHEGIAYERFTANGPLAMLPLRTKVMSLVWSHPASSATRIKALSDAQFLSELQQEFGWYLGQLKHVGQRAYYPLKQHRVVKETGTRSLLIGNAAHTLHPIAGQGLNLTMRDIATLVSLYAQYINHKDDPMVILKKYSLARGADQVKVTNGTDLLNRLFVSKQLPLIVGRQIAMHGFASFPVLKSRLAKHALGFVWK